MQPNQNLERLESTPAETWDKVVMDRCGGALVWCLPARIKVHPKNNA